MSTLDSVLATARNLAVTVLAPDCAAVDREGRWPERGVRALLEAGLGGLVAPREVGGHGLGLEALARTCEVLAEGCPSTALCFGMHCVGVAVLAAKRTAWIDERYLRPVAQGRHLTTLCLSEPGTGSDFYLPQSRLLDRGDTLVVTGEKSFVTNGGHSDSYVVSTVAADPQAPPGEFSCLVVDGDARGLVWGPPWTGFGMRGNSSRGLTLDGVVVPRQALLGEVGDEIWYVFQVVAPYFLMAMAGTYVGIGSSALRDVIDHVSHRYHAHSGRALAAEAVVQHRVGTLWAAVERTRRLVYAAGHMADTGDPAALVALCSAKAEVADGIVQVVNDAMTLMGGRAYQEDSRIARLLRDVRAAHVMAPTTDHLRLWAGRALLGRPLLADG